MLENAAESLLSVVRTPVLHLIGGRIFGYFERDAAKYAESAFQITPFLPDDVGGF
ncbi:MAG: hypothetical protein JETCAE02_03500 [Anaerolineaceae bacterium]|nr:hypothetical protein [Chloroflexota bacterium]WKZ53186.1 MAG: hypothetical protein QY324_10165 [Anaerolineales bacterium]GIK10568.1 MAG: hypothetical protein BroJett001_26340 [Chloroflexota bacterium]GJQ37938.1 MAG: hypothetical protein JETCAE02_03500 [Anaerolineaceae bacterium]HMM99738.1 hypothetical protein [Anaerolineales bacterium]